MELKLDLSKSYGIVLEGGGAKGAYQIGAWKALEETGVKIKGIAGVSVGALNGALICMNVLEQAEDLWKNISYDQVIDMDEPPVKQLKRVVKEHGLDISPLKELIKNTIDIKAIRESERELYIVTYSVTDKELLTIDLKEVEEDRMADFLLASAYFLAFKNEKIHGKRYLDGGGFDNVPIQCLLDQGYQDIIVIRIYGMGVDTVKRVKIPDSVSLFHIAPRSHLGGILQFEAKKARRNMRLGYFDAKRMLYGLDGKQYYIDCEESQWTCLERLVEEIGNYLPHFDQISRPLRPGEDEYRFYLERVFPQMGKYLQLGEDWDYKKLYLGVLEYLARKQKLNRFLIYTTESFCHAVNENLKLLDSPNQV